MLALQHAAQSLRVYEQRLILTGQCPAGSGQECFTNRNWRKAVYREDTESMQEIIWMGIA